MASSPGVISGLPVMPTSAKIVCQSWLSLFFAEVMT